MIQVEAFDSTLENHDLDLFVGLDRRHDLPELQNKFRAHQIEWRVVEYHAPTSRGLSIQPYLCSLRCCVHQGLQCGGHLRHDRNYDRAAPTLLLDHSIA